MQSTARERFTAIWTYPWDLLAEGLDKSLERIAQTGLTAISLAVSYHAGMLFLPHNPRQRVRFLEDGAIYFHPADHHFRGTDLQPRFSDLTVEQDPLGDTCQVAQRHGLKVIAWTVCCHNSYQGERHPDAVSRNAFGDPYIFNLCPTQPKTRAYLLALMRALSDYPLQTIQLESYGFGGFTHGYHHEKVLANLDPLSAHLMGLCFCPACQRAAEQRGVDFEQVRQATCAYLEAAFEGRQPARCASREEMVDALPLLAPYLEMRDDVITEWVQELSRASRKPLALLGAAPRMAEVQQGIAEVTECAYRMWPEEVERDVQAARRAISPDLTLSIGLEANPHLSPCAENLKAKVRAAWQAGADGLYFYNYGLMPLRSLGWLKDALHERP